jgi:hypothetical protein
MRQIAQMRYYLYELIADDKHTELAKILVDGTKGPSFGDSIFQHFPKANTYILFN